MGNLFILRIQFGGNLATNVVANDTLMK